MTLSERICRLAGIEPQIHVDIYQAESYHYPDLTEPENFVKALESLRKVTGVRFAKLVVVGLGVGETFTDALLDYLEQLSIGTGDYEVQYSKVKQALQQTEWRY